MKTQDMSKIKAIKYFNKINKTNKNKIEEDELESLNEKIKLYRVYFAKC